MPRRLILLWYRKSKWIWFRVRLGSQGPVSGQKLTSAFEIFEVRSQFFLSNSDEGSETQVLVRPGFTFRVNVLGQTALIQSFPFESGHPVSRGECREIKIKSGLPKSTGLQKGFTWTLWASQWPKNLKMNVKNFFRFFPPCFFLPFRDAFWKSGMFFNRFDSISESETIALYWSFKEGLLAPRRCALS